MSDNANETWIYWRQRLSAAQNHRPLVSWTVPIDLTPAEASLIGPSIAEFQLGESGQGSHLFKCAREWAAKTDAPDYVPALRLLFEDEARHSSELRRFMDMAGISVKSASTLAACFKRLRKLAGLEMMVVTLLTAELVAIPYYRALAAATGSATLRSLCRAMLSDESLHIGFQAALLRDAQNRHSPWRAAFSRARMIVILQVTGGLVWLRHRHFFVTAGFGWRRYVKTLHQARSKAFGAAAIGDRRPSTSLVWRAKISR